MAESNVIVVSNNLLGYRITDDLIELAIGGALDEVHTHILDRIFNQNKDVNGGGFGGYSESYAKYRKSLGLQSGTKDLQLSDRLRNSIYVDKEKRAIMLSNQTDMQLPARNGKLKSSNITQSAKARMNEKYLGQDIFSADKFEREVAMKVFKDIIFEKLNDSR